jgi:CRISPR type III-B/RAMP module RAMP protein Cmr1
MWDGSIELEFVTPVFMAGANQSGKAGVKGEAGRVPSLRGVLRFWLRAALSADDGDLCKLRASESKLFGDTSRRSLIRIRVVEADVGDPMSWDDLSSSLMGSRKTADSHGFAGQPRSVSPSLLKLDYLGGWAFKKSKTREARYGYFKKGGYIQYELLVDPYRRGCWDDDDTVRKHFFAALWGLSYLGGLGSRSGRGFGSVQVRRVEGNLLSNVPDGINPCVPEAGGLEALADGIKKGKEFIENNVAIGEGGGDYSNLKNSRLWVFANTKKWRDWWCPLEWVATKYKDYRTDLKPKKRRIPFGLPISGEPVFERRSSPVRWKVLKTGNGEYFLVVIFFNFKPEKFLGGKTVRDVNPYDANPDVILKFIEGLKKAAQDDGGQCKEVW